MKFNIITLGCKVNSYESNFMKEALVKNGFSFCNLNEKCDILILNTCTVTDTSDKKSLKEVRRLKRENPNAILVVCGCSVQNDKTKYDDLGINILMGNINKSNIVSIIEKYLDDKTPVEYVAKTRDLPFENMEVDISDHTRAYIKIEDGCDNFCSYCIIPFVRGKKRSKDFSLVLREVQHLANNGYKEIVLTGIDTGGYESNDKDLTDLICEMSKINGIERIRQSSIEIAQINEGSPLPFRPHYRFLVNAYQIAGNNLEKIFTILKNNSQLTKSFKDKEFGDLNETELKQFQERVDNVVNWLDNYAPKFVKFQVQEKSVPKLPLTDEQTQFLSDLADLMESKEFNKAEDLHDAMYEILEGQGLKPQKGFQAIYKMILGQKQGPRAASFLLSLDKDFVVKRLRQEA